MKKFTFKQAQERNWIKFRLKGALTLFNNYQVLLSPEERIAFSKIQNELKIVLLDWEKNNYELKRLLSKEI